MSRDYKATDCKMASLMPACIHFLTWICTCFGVTRAQSCEGPMSQCPIFETCCTQPDYHCCTHNEYNRELENRRSNFDSDETFVQTGLKSALVLLIMSTAIFLVCFCVMKCCKNAVNRGSARQHQVTIADYRMAQMLSGSCRGSGRHLHLSLLTDGNAPHLPPTTSTDEPPSYSEVVGATTSGGEVGENYEPSEMEALDPSINDEKPPPEYSTMVKESDIP